DRPREILHRAPHAAGISSNGGVGAALGQFDRYGGEPSHQPRRQSARAKRPGRPDGKTTASIAPVAPDRPADRSGTARTAAVARLKPSSKVRNFGEAAGTKR